LHVINSYQDLFHMELEMFAHENSEEGEVNTAKADRLQHDMEKKPSIFKKIGDWFYVMKPLMLSHHPICEYYDEHTFRLFGRDFCIGCFIGYPSAIITLLIGYFTGLFSQFNGTELFTIGIIFCCSYFLSIFGFTERKKIKITSKILIGMGSAFVIASIMTINTEIWLRLLIVLIFSQSIMSVMGIKRQKEMKRICNTCEYQNNRNICPGMGVIQRNMRRLGYVDKSKPLSEQDQ